MKHLYLHARKNLLENYVSHVCHLSTILFFWSPLSKSCPRHCPEPYYATSPPLITVYCFTGVSQNKNYSSSIIIVWYFFPGIFQHAPVDRLVHGRVHRTTVDLVQAIPFALQKPKHRSRGELSSTKIKSLKFN